MADLIDDLIDDLEETLQGIKDGKEDRAGLIEDADGLLQQLQDSIIDVSDPAKKKEYTQRHQSFKAQLASLKKKALMGDQADKSGAFDPHMAKGQESLDVLERARAQLQETEEVGINTLENLERQRETMGNTKKNAKEVNSNLATSNRLLTRMGKWWRG